MKKMENTVHCEGYLYEHNLTKKVTGPNSKKPGTEFISGTFSLATDENLTNIVEFHYTYATAVTSSGKNNATYGYLSDIIDGKLKTAMEVGKEGAAKLRIDSAFGLNDFYVEENGEWRLVSVRRNEGGFIHLITEINEPDRNRFRADVVLTKFTRLEADPEKNLPERGVMSGVSFDFRGQLLPMDFVIYNPEGLDYLDGCEISNKNPLCTWVFGQQVSTTIKVEKIEHSAFGGDVVTESSSVKKECVVTKMAVVPYEWDTEEFVTAEKLNTLVTDRETYLAGVKQRAIEWKKQKAQNATTASALSQPAVSVSSGGFNF